MHQEDDEVRTGTIAVLPQLVDWKLYPDSNGELSSCLKAESAGGIIHLSDIEQPLMSPYLPTGDFLLGIRIALISAIGKL